MLRPTRSLCSLLSLLSLAACNRPMNERDSGAPYPMDAALSDAPPATDAGGRRACVRNAGVVPGGVRVALTAERQIPVFVRFPEGVRGPAPVVVFVTGGGLGGDPGTSSECWGRTLARAGYVVIHASHPIPPTCSATGCTDPTFVNNLCTAHGVPMSACAANYSNLVRAHDLRAVLDDLDCIEADLQARGGGEITLDRERIAAVGWSGGTRGVEIMAGADVLAEPSTVRFSMPDARVKSLVVMSPTPATESGFYCSTANTGCCFANPTVTCPGWQAQSSWGRITVPTLVQSGDGDCSDGGGKTGPMRRVTFEGAGSAVKSLVYIDHPGCDATWGDGPCSNGCRFRHESFNLSGADSCMPDGTLVPPTPGNADSVYSYGVSRVLVSAARAFLDANLRGRAEARDWLASDRLETLSTGYVVWPGDAAQNGSCSTANLAQCEYAPAATYPVGTLGTPGRDATYYTLRVTSY